MHLLQEMVYILSVFTISNVWNKKSIQERFISIYVSYSSCSFTSWYETNIYWLGQNKEHLWTQSQEYLQSTKGAQFSQKMSP